MMLRQHLLVLASQLLVHPWSITFVGLRLREAGGEEKCNV